MNHGLVDGVAGLVGEDAGGQAGHHLPHIELVAHLQDDVVHLHVVPEKVTVCLHVGKESSDEGGEVDHVRGLVLLKQGSGLALTQQVSVLVKG